MFERHFSHQLYPSTNLYFFNPEEPLLLSHEPLLLSPTDLFFYGYAPATPWHPHPYCRLAPSYSPFAHPRQRGVTLQQLEQWRKQERQKKRLEQEHLERLEEERRLRQIQLEEEQQQRRRDELLLAQMREQLERGRQEEQQRLQEEKMLLAQRRAHEKEKERIFQEQALKRRLQQKREELLRRQEEERQKQLLLRRQEEERQKQQQEAALALKRLEEEQQRQRQQEAARKIVRRIQAFKEVKRARQLAAKLRELRQISTQLTQLKEEREASVFSAPIFAEGRATPVKAFLEYEDAVLRLLLKLDEISSEGSEVVRETRKRVIEKAQKILSSLDHLKTACQVKVNEEELKEKEKSTEEKIKEEVNEKEGKVSEEEASGGEVTLEKEESNEEGKVREEVMVTEPGVNGKQQGEKVVEEVGENDSGFLEPQETIESQIGFEKIEKAELEEVLAEQPPTEALSQEEEASQSDKELVRVTKGEEEKLEEESSEGEFEQLIAGFEAHPGKEEGPEVVGVPTSSDSLQTVLADDDLLRVASSDSSEDGFVEVNDL